MDAKIKAIQSILTYSKSIDNSLTISCSKIKNLAIETFKLINKICETKNVDDYLISIKKLLQLIHENPDLSEEVYFQLIKQLNNTPIDKSNNYELHLWDILSCLCNCILPPKNMNKYVLSFLIERKNNTVEEYFKELTGKGNRKFILNELEISQIIKNERTLVCIKTMDASSQKYAVGSLTTVSDLLEQILHKLTIRNVNGWGLVCQGVFVKGSEYVWDVFNKCDKILDFELKKRVILADQECESAEYNLLYYQTMKSYLFDEMLINEKLSLQLGGLKAQITFGDLIHNAKDNKTLLKARYDLKEFIPFYLIERQSHEAWLNGLVESHSKLAGKTSIQCKNILATFNVNQIIDWEFNLEQIDISVKKKTESISDFSQSINEISKEFYGFLNEFCKKQPRKKNSLNLEFEIKNLDLIRESLIQSFTVRIPGPDTLYKMENKSLFKSKDYELLKSIQMIKGNVFDKNLIKQVYSDQDWSFSKNRLINSISNKDEMENEAKNIQNLIQIYSTGKSKNNKKQISSNELLQSLLIEMIKNENYKDETFLQLIKQTTKIPSSEKLNPPSEKEIFALLNHKPAVCTIHSGDGQKRSLTFSPISTISDILECLCEKIGIKSATEFGLFDPLDNLLEPGSLMGDLFYEFEKKSFEYKLILKKIYFFQPLLPSGSDYEEHLTFIQAEKDVFNGQHPLTEDEAINLAGLSIQNSFGDQNFSRLKSYDAPLKSLFPLNFLQEYKDIHKKVETAHSSLKGTCSADARKEYLKIIRQWPFHGTCFFPVKQNSFNDIDREINLGVSVTGLHYFINWQKEPFKSVLYSEIVEIIPSTTYIIIVQQNSKIMFQTDKATRILSLVQGYIDYNNK
ncbi:hypothetical protein ROZALSC1DRAFT_22628 [Rozella allomycis CSF55]|uniref:FERM domain-containing protein n=1 Tax=Rozella allomycis (strain CSF55) TaxID=988480 RepID=A0A4P9YHN6_ROZAC|nr:hypothetical protein ROZALSC1DRAFT_22628 [Rozella allomycis CSF55]